MRSEALALSESFVAHIAHVRPYSGVGAQMGGQVRSLDKSFSTLLAPVRPLSRVGAQMFSQVFRPFERQWAEVAFKNSLVRVFSQSLLLLVVKSVRAHITTFWLPL